MPVSLEPRSASWRWTFAAGSLGTQVVFAVTPAFLPLFLEARAGATALEVGGLLAIGAAAGIVTLPAVAALSDRTAGRWGARLPYLLAGVPAAAAGLVALAAADALPVAAAAMALTYVGLNVYLGPYRACLAEQVPPAQQNGVSAIQTAFKGLGSLAVLGGGGLLFGWRPDAPFLVVAAAWTVCALLAAFAVALGPRAEASGTDAAPAAPLELRGLGRYFTGLALAWFAFHTLFAFTLPFVVHDLAGVADVASPAGRASAAAAMPVLAFFALVATVAAIPVGKLADRVGATPVLLGGLAATLGGTLLATLWGGMEAGYAFAVLAGLGFACVQVVPFPMLAARRPAASPAGLASAFELTIDVAQLVAMPVVGALVWAGGAYRLAFVAALVALAGAIACFAERGAR